jgi:raffinose/stachyose/melibiose transport system substrate-binding protein
MTVRLWRLIAPLALVALVAGCGAPGDDNDDDGGNAKQPAAKKVDVAKAGNVTLTVWDQEVRGGQERQIKRLNTEFQRRYPNVKIKRTAKSFDDLNTTLKLAVSGNKAPDVVQANQGRPVMGELVKGRLLRPLDNYAKAYGWESRYSKLLVDLNRFSPDAAEFGTGSLYGLSQAGEIVGVFYNKEKVGDVPSNLEEFEQALADAKADGDTPIQFGNLDKWPGIHEFETVQAQFADKQAIRDFVFARSGAKFATPENEEAAAKLKEWVDKGYFTKDFNGTGYDPAWQSFAKGKGRFLIAGTWLVGDLTDAMGDKVGFFPLPGRDGGDPVALGGEGLPFAVTSKSKHPDVAAAYIDFLTNENAVNVLAATGNLPAPKIGKPKPQGTLLAEVFDAWRRLNESDGIVPYLDYATPDFYDQITAGVQRLMAGRQSPAEFTQSLQSDYAEFASSR